MSPYYYKNNRTRTKYNVSKWESIPYITTIEDFSSGTLPMTLLHK